MSLCCMLKNPKKKDGKKKKREKEVKMKHDDMDKRSISKKKSGGRARGYD